MHPDFARWTSEETVVSAVAVREGTLVTMRNRVLDDVLSPGFLAANDPSRRVRPESHLLIRGKCVYRWDGDRSKAPAEYCFPMAKDSSWGQMAADGAPDYEFYWRVSGVNADPFGAPGGRTFHFSAHEGSGTICDRWFQKEVGLLQEVSEHHGTYGEERRQLVSARIGGKGIAFRLTPARASSR